VIELVDINRDTPVRNWPGVAEINYNRLDNYIGDPGPHSYTPTFAAVAGTDQPNIGADGTVEGYWYHVLDIVHVWGKILWSGSGINQGAGSNWFTCSLPVPINGLTVNISTGAGTLIGWGAIRDNDDVSAASQTIGVQAVTLGTVLFPTEQGIAQRALRNDMPFSWATGDSIVWGASYRGVF
jgi:hypothetical protein